MSGVGARVLRGDAPTPVRVTPGQSPDLNANQRAVVEATRAARADKHTRRRTLRISLGTTVIMVQHGLGRIPQTVQLKRVISGATPSYVVEAMTTKHLKINSAAASEVEFEVW